MARTNKWMVKVKWHGMDIISTVEHKIFKLPHKKVSIADYPVVDMHDVMVSKDGSDVPEDLLLAHPANPMKLTGVVVVDGKQYLLSFPGISGFSVEDGENGLKGDCNLFALGSYRWYRICSAVQDYQPMLRNMHNEARIYWILRDLRGDWMNTVDQQMAKTYPFLQDDTSAAYQGKVEGISRTMEPLDMENYQHYWQTVHQYMCPTETPSWHKGFDLGKNYTKYLINHMVVDEKSLFWINSLLFRRICRHDPAARDEIFERHSMDVPNDWVSSIQRTIMNTDFTMESHPNMDDSEKELSQSVKDESSSGSTVTDENNIENNFAIMVDDVVSNSRKRKRSSTPDYESGSTVSVSGHKKADKSHGWNDFERANRPTVANANPSMSKTGLSKLLGRMFRDQRVTSKVHFDSAAASIGWSDLKRTSSVQSEASSTVKTIEAPGDRNFRSTIPIKRTSNYFTRGGPFDQITGNVKQASITVEILQSMIYEEEVSDVNMADIFFVWQRDYGTRADKVIALISSQVGTILELLSATDKSGDRERHRAVDTTNIWLSTTLYDQLYKLYRITDQDSNLLLLVQWQEQDIFEALQNVNGIWYPKDDKLITTKDPEPEFPIKQEEDLYDNDHSLITLSDDTESNISDSRTKSRKGRSSLRPAAKAAKSKYVRNGAGPKYPRRSITTSIRPITLPQRPVHDAEGQQTTLFIIDSDEDELTSSQSNSFFESAAPKVLKQNANNAVANPMPKLYAVPQLRLVRGPETSGNNAGIWRCAIPGCYFFQDHVASCQGQEAIMAHYNGHASTMLERIELVGEAAVAGSSTAALVRKLEQEAKQWREAMKRDAMILG